MIEDVLAGRAMWDVYQGDVLSGLAQLPDGCIQTCVTSPPYYALRDYGLPTSVWGGLPDCPHDWGILRTPRLNGGGGNLNPYATKRAVKGSENYSQFVDPKDRATYSDVCTLCGAWQGTLGLEPSVKEFIEHLVAVFREVRRVLRDDGTCWLNIGDSYSSGNRASYDKSLVSQTSGLTNRASGGSRPKMSGAIKPKDLCLIPQRLAIALQDDGWYIRSWITWCLSGGTWVYVKTQKGEMPMMIRDMARLDPKTVKLWNGDKWTQVLGWSRTARNNDELELVLRSGERISCTPNHEWPTERGLLRADTITVGDILINTQLPEPEHPLDTAHINEDVAWFVGLYLAEGSTSGRALNIAGHVKETERWERVQRIAHAYGGTATRSISGNKMNIRVYGRVLHAFIAQFMTGRVAKNKGISPICYRYSNKFLRALLDGYLSGDGYYDAANDRWRLGFTRNYNLERDLRTICARLNIRLKLSTSFVAYNGGQVPTFRGEIRFTESNHYARKQQSEVVEIRKARCREVYDIGVEDEPHLFALASGVLTHNCKKSPMPESVRDRPTNATEVILLMAKSEKYYYDQTAVREQAVYGELLPTFRGGGAYVNNNSFDNSSPLVANTAGLDRPPTTSRNMWNYWLLGPEPQAMMHFATFVSEIPRRAIKAGTSERGCCPSCGKAWARVVSRSPSDWPERKANGEPIRHGLAGAAASGAGSFKNYNAETKGWRPSCECSGDAGKPCNRCGGAGVVTYYEDGGFVSEGSETVECPECNGLGSKTWLLPLDPAPCLVLDPFAGSGTTLSVAVQLGRRAIGIELSPDYVRLLEGRMQREAAGYTPAFDFEA